MHLLRHTVLGTAVYAITSASAWAFSFQGEFQQDNDVQLFALTLEKPAQVDLRTYSFNGGTNNDGAEIPDGGFDPILTLFDSSGNKVAFHDDIDEPTAELDARLGPDLGVLSAGTYTLALTMYDNFAGNRLADGFQFDGTPQFCDPIEDDCGDRRWAVDILGADAAAPLAAIPLPSNIGLLGIGLAALLTLASRPISRRFA